MGEWYLLFNGRKIEPVEPCVLSAVSNGTCPGSTLLLRVSALGRLKIQPSGHSNNLMAWTQAAKLYEDGATLGCPI